MKNPRTITIKLTISCLISFISIYKAKNKQEFVFAKAANTFYYFYYPLVLCINQIIVNL